MNRSNQETLALMDAVRTARGLSSDYQLAQLLGAQSSYTTAWRKGRHLSDEYAAKCAELAGLDPVETVLRVAAERESGKTAEILSAALVRLLRHVASVVLGLTLLVCSAHFATPAEACALAAAPAVASPVIYYAKFAASWLARRALRFLAHLEPPMVLA